MTVRVAANDEQVADFVGRAANVTRLLSDLSRVWQRVGVKVQEHIADRWTNGYQELAPLATGTLYAKAKRHGYYKQAPGAGPYLRRRGEKAFWWTGAAMRQALGADAFEALPKSLVIDFGRDTEPRRNLSRMHFGGERRPARPLYDLVKVQEIADFWVRDYVDAVLESAGLGQTAFSRSP